MSLELAIQKNTEVLLRLIATIEAAGVATVGGEDQTDQKKSVTTLPVAETPKAVTTESAVTPPSELTYDDVKKPFLRLVNSNKPAALELLKSLGIASLTEIQKTPEKFNEVLAAINAKAGE